jgi:hypothetical protein
MYVTVDMDLEGVDGPWEVSVSVWNDLTIDLEEDVSAYSEELLKPVSAGN